MRIYLDTSALAKLVQSEAESAALRKFLRRHRDDGGVGSELSRTELIRAVIRSKGGSLAHARRVLGRLDLIRLDVRLLDDAATLMPADLRSLDAIHLASARVVGAELRALVTYDARMARAAESLGLPVEIPR